MGRSNEILLNTDGIALRMKLENLHSEWCVAVAPVKHGRLQLRVFLDDFPSAGKPLLNDTVSLVLPVGHLPVLGAASIDLR